MYTLERYRRVAFGIACGVLALISFFVLLPLWQVLAWGIALSIIVYPIRARLGRRLNDTWAALITTILTLLFIVGPVVLIALAAWAEIKLGLEHLRAIGANLQTASPAADIVGNLTTGIESALRSFGIKDFDVRAEFQHYVDSAVKSTPQLLARIGKNALMFVFSLLLLFFILRDGHRLRKPATDLIPLPERQSQQVLDSVYDTVHATFYGIVWIAILNGITIGALFFALGLPSPVLWGIISTIISILPLVGVPFVYVPWALYLASQGNWFSAITLTLVGFIVITIGIDKLYRSRIIGHRSNLHEVAVLFSMVGGVLALGAVGTFVGPVIVIIALGAISVIREMSQTEDIAKQDV